MMSQQRIARSQEKANQRRVLSKTDFPSSAPPLSRPAPFAYSPAATHVGQPPGAPIDPYQAPHCARKNNQPSAQVNTRRAFTAALTAAQANWLTQILVLVAADHAAGGATDTEEHAIVDPMRRRICWHARASGWPACPPLCP